jgi:hypothetical protein
MALFSARYGPLFALLLIPILATYIDFDLKGHFPRVVEFFRNREATVASVEGLARGITWPVLTVVFSGVFILNGRISYGFDPEIKPIKALEFLSKEHVPGNVFNNDEFGDLMIYSLSDRYKVFIDGRLDMYHSAGILKEYFKVSSFEENWDSTLNKYGVGWILFDTKSQFSRFLQTRPDWKLIYSDKVASIFVRNIPEYKQIIDRYPDRKLAKTDDDPK